MVGDDDNDDDNDDDAVDDDDDHDVDYDDDDDDVDRDADDIPKTGVDHRVKGVFVQESQVELSHNLLMTL